MAEMRLGPFTLPGAMLSEVEPAGHRKPRFEAWTENGMTYVACNTPLRPTLPPYSVVRGRPTNGELRRLDWVRDGYIYLAFLPVPVEYRGPLLRRLQVDEQRIPINEVPLNHRIRCKLDPKLAQSWLRLEEALVKVANLLLPLTGFSTNIRLPPRPKCRELMFQKDSREECIKFVLDTRDAFLPWLALVSFCIAALDGMANFHMKSNIVERHAVWIGNLLCSPDVHPGWVGWLVDSPLSWFGGTTRLGTIIHYERNPYALLVGLMSERNVPVVYCLSSSNKDGLPLTVLRDKYLSWYRNMFDRDATEADMELFLRKYVPPPEAIRTASSSWQAFGESNVTPDDLRARLDPKSGQKLFETREQFLARREKENVELIAGETPRERQRREARHTTSLDAGPPDRESKTRVFVWEKFGDWEIRTSQSPFVFEMLFITLHKKEETKYDAVRNEWDLWRNEPIHVPPLGGESEGAEWDWEEGSGSLDGTGADLSLFEHDLCEESGEICSREVQPEPSEVGVKSSIRTKESLGVARKFPLDVMLREWYGLIIEPNGSARSHPITLPTNIAKDVKDICDNLDKENRIKVTFVDSVSNYPKQALAVRHFLSHYIAGSPAALGTYSDLNVRTLGDFYGSRIRLLPSKYTAKAVDDPKSPKIQLFGIELLDERGHQVEDRDHRRLFFWNATTLVAVLRLPRERTRSVSHIAEYLIELGAGFLMTIPRAHIRTPFEDLRVSGLGRRWRGYKPDMGDFAMYQQKCREIFSIRRLRRALRCGGILRRIALQFITTDEGLDGPIYEAINEPLWVCDAQSDRGEYVEDGLSLKEIHLLIGSFELCDEKSNNKSVWCSYWPPPWIWESSGYFVGYWTPDCEDWFVNRLKRMKAGTNTDPLLCVEEWKGVLKRFRYTKRMVNTLEEHCNSFLQGKNRS